MSDGPDVKVLGADDPKLALAVLREERRRRTRFLWRQGDGALVDVREMSDAHLANAVALLERRAHEREVLEWCWGDAP